MIKQKLSSVMEVIKFSLLFSVFCYALPVLFFIFTFALNIELPEPLSDSLSILLDMSGFIIFFLFFLKNKFTIKNELKNKFFKPHSRDILFLVPFMFGTFILSQSIMRFLNLSKDSSETSNSTGNDNLYILGIIVLVFYTSIYAPVVEETVFRGIIQSFLSKELSSIVSIFITSLIFSAFHKSVGGFVYSFIFSLVIGFVYIKSNNNLILVMFGHFLINFFSKFFILLSYDPLFNISYGNSIFRFTTPLIVLSAVLFIFCFVYFVRKPKSIYIDSFKEPNH